MRVECTKTDMLVTLAFGYPFNGRVYVNGNYQVKKSVYNLNKKKYQINVNLKNMKSRVSRWVMANSN